MHGQRERNALGLLAEIQNSHLDVIFFSDKQQVKAFFLVKEFCGFFLVRVCPVAQVCMKPIAWDILTRNIICCLSGSHGIGCLLFFPEPGNHSRERCINQLHRSKGNEHVEEGRSIWRRLGSDCDGTVMPGQAV